MVVAPHSRVLLSVWWRLSLGSVPSPGRSPGKHPFIIWLRKRSISVRVPFNSWSFKKLFHHFKKLSKLVSISPSFFCNIVPNCFENCLQNSFPLNIQFVTLWTTWNKSSLTWNPGNTDWHCTLNIQQSSSISLLICVSTNCSSKELILSNAVVDVNWQLIIYRLTQSTMIRLWNCWTNLLSAPLLAPMYLLTLNVWSQVIILLCLAHFFVSAS